MKSGVLLAALGMLGGCERVSQISAIPAGGSGAADAAGGADASAVDAATPCFEDTFEPTGLELTNWTPFTEQNTLVTVDGNLVVSLDSTGGHAYAGIDSARVRNMVGVRTELDVVGLSPVPTAGADAYMQWKVDSTHFYAIGVDGPDIYFEELDGTTDNVDRQTYDRADPVRYWRIEHQPSPNDVVFWTRTETGPWLERKSFPATVPLDALTVEIGAGTYMDFNTPGQARFDNFRLYCP